MEYIHGLSLREYINLGYYVNEEGARDIIAQLLLVSEHLSDQNIIHRDIKPDNILLDNNNL